jgi:hypothetical protein
MRILLKAQLPTENGNAKFRDGSLGESLDSILSDTKPEAVYFLLEGGLRTVVGIFEMEDSSKLPALVEPWFLAFGATVEVTPVLTTVDFEQAGPSFGEIVQKYG